MSSNGPLRPEERGTDSWRDPTGTISLCRKVLPAVRAAEPGRVRASTMVPAPRASAGRPTAGRGSPGRWRPREEVGTAPRDQREGQVKWGYRETLRFLKPGSAGLQL